MESGIESAYDGLTDRQRLIGANLNRLQSQRFQTPFEGDLLLLKIWDFEPFLSHIPIWAIDHCFVEAVKVHRSEFPVQANEISRTWLDMSDSTKAELFEKTGIKTLVKGDCEWCNGTGRMRMSVRVVKMADPELKKPAITEGTPVKWNDSTDTNTMDICFCRKS